MSLLEKKLTKTWAQEVMSDEKRLITAIIHDLHKKGEEIAEELKRGEYKTLEDYLAEQDKGRSPFCLLEGKADRKSNVFVLKGCPMAKLLDSLRDENGDLPEFYARICEKYKTIYKTKGGILHPFCIVHQVIRSKVGENVRVKGNPIRMYQVACRALKTGKIAYATEGMDRIGLDTGDVNEMIDGKACMYLAKF